MEHSLHLGAGHFVKGVAPTSSRNILKKGPKLADPEDDLEDVDDGVDDGEGEDGEGEGEGGFEIADSIGKALALVNQVSILFLRSSLEFTASLVSQKIRKSPQARAFFEKACNEVGVPRLQLLLWVKTRWASLFTFLDRILILQQVCHK